MDVQPLCESEGKLSVIDMQSLPDWKYTYILCYQDRISRILILHAIETRLPSEIAFILCDILHLLGTPAFIRSENGNAFVTRVLREVKAIWPSCNFCVQPQQQQQQSPEDEDLFAGDYVSNVCVLENLRAWMSKHNSSNWSLGLKLVQFKENSRNYLEQFEFMFDYKFPVELAETLMPFEALGCLKTKEELNQILEESISTGIENVHSALGGSSSYGVMFGDSEISEGPKYHSLGRTRKKRLVYNGNFTIGKSRNNKLSVLNVPQLSSECSGSKKAPPCIKDRAPLSPDETSTGCFTDNGSVNKKRLCKVKKSELKRFEILLFSESSKDSHDRAQPENMNNEKFAVEEKSETYSKLREVMPSDSLETKCDPSLDNSTANVSTDAMPDCEPSELKTKPVKDLIKFMELQCCQQKEKIQKPRIKIEKSCEFLTSADTQPIQGNPLHAENNVVMVGQPAQTFHRSYKNLSPEFCRRICIFDNKVEFEMPLIPKELTVRQSSRRQSNSCFDCRPCQLFNSENSTAKDPDRVNEVDDNPCDPAKDLERTNATDTSIVDLAKGESKHDPSITDIGKTSSTAVQDSERDPINSMVDQNLPPKTETSMDTKNFESGVSSDRKPEDVCDVIDTNAERLASNCGEREIVSPQLNERSNRQSGNFQDSLCLLNVKAIVNKLETLGTRCSSCENLNRRSIAVEREVGVRDIIRQLESFAGPHPKWRTLQIIQNRDECSSAVQYSRKNSSAALLDDDPGDSGLPFLEENNNPSDDDKDVDEKNTSENDDDDDDDESSSSDSDLDKTPTNEDMADSLHDSGFGILVDNIPRDTLTEEKSDNISDADDPKRAPPLGEVIQSSDASDDVFSFTEDVEQRLNTVIFRLKSESDVQDSEVEELEDDSTKLETEKDTGSDTKIIFRDAGFGVRRPLKGLRCNSCSLLTDHSRSNLNKNRSFSTECVIRCYASAKDKDEDRNSLLFKPQIFKLDCNGTGQQAESKYHYTVTHKGRSWYIPGYENPPCITNSDDEGIEVEFVTDIENDLKEALDGLDSLNLERHGSQENIFTPAVCTPAVCTSVHEERCSFVSTESCIWDHSSDTGDNLCTHCQKRIHKMCGIREKPHEEHCYLLCPVCHVVEKSLLVKSPPDKFSWQKPKQFLEKRNILRGKSFYAIETKPYCEPCYVNTLEKCSVCSKPVIDRLLRATGKPYHPACFTCVVCGMSLDGVPFTVDATNQIHCIEDFHKKFAPRCCVCQHPIMPDPGKEETVRVVAMDRSFHVQCYCCEDCGMLLSSEAEGRGCYPLDDHILCKHCNAKRIQALTTKMATEL